MKSFALVPLVLLLFLAFASPARSTDFPGGIAIGTLTDPPELQANCARMIEDDSGATVIGAVMPRIVRSPGVYDYSTLDAQIDAAISCGAEPALRVFATPTSDDDRGLPDDLAAYADFVRNLVEHTKGRVQRFGIENEVIAPSHWRDTPADYFQLLGVAAEAAHQANPGAIVLDSVSSSGGFSIIEARKLWLAGDVEGALAVIQESQTNDLGGGPYLTSTSQVPGYLSVPRVLKMQEFYDQLVANRGLIDALQLHYYGPASSIPSVIAMVRADGFDMPIEIWELGRRYLDGRPFEQQGQADESTKLLATTVGEGARFAVLQQYFDKPENQMFGLVDPQGASRIARSAVRNTIAMTKGTVAAHRDLAGSGTDGYRFDIPAGWRRVLWSTGSPVLPGNRLGIRSTTVAVTENQGGTTHVAAKTVAIGPSPRWIEPDMIQVARRAPGRRGAVRVEAACPPASPTPFCRGWIRLRGGKGKRVLIAERKYKIGRGVVRKLDIRRKRTKARAKVMFAVPFACPGGLETCRSWQNLTP